MSNNIVAEVVRELVDTTVREEERMKNEGRRNEEELVMTQHQETREEQFGGASVKVLRVENQHVNEGFAKHLKIIHLVVRLPDNMTMNPNGAEDFGEMIVELIHQYAPSEANTDTRVGVTFDSAEFETGAAVGLSITPIEKVRVGKIVETMELLSQSDRSPLTLQTPTLTVTLKYIIPPSGSGKRGKEFEMEQILESGHLFGKKRRVENEDEDGAIDMMDFIDEAAEDSCDEDEDEDDFDGDLDEVEGPKSRDNIMRNDVSRDCLPHALFQSYMYHLKSFGETAEERRKGAALYKQSIMKNISIGNKSEKLHREVQAMKREAGMVKTGNFGHADIELLQDTFFAGKVQIIAIVEHQATPYFAGPYLGENKTIAVFLKDVDGKGHYAGVRKLPALLKTKFYCCLCQVRCGSVINHYNCPRLHQPCGALDCTTSPDDAPLCCVKCTVVFRSQTCLDNHLKKGRLGGKSRCEYSKLCKKCGEIFGSFLVSRSL